MSFTLIRSKNISEEDKGLDNEKKKRKKNQKNAKNLKKPAGSGTPQEGQKDDGP